MNFLPIIRRCPHCQAINMIRVNGTTYEDMFKSFANWTLKKNLIVENVK
jgi:hypothetical protein